jgi:Na+/H+-dicarboxylate symporters
VSLTTRVLLALAAGVGLGLVLSGIDANLSRRVADAVEPAGTLFVNAIRMTVIPLVVSSLIVGIATSGGGGALARIGLRGVAVFLVLLTLSGVVGALVGGCESTRERGDEWRRRGIRSTVDPIAG